MNIQDINNLANDIAVLRSEANIYKQELENLLQSEAIRELENKIKKTNNEKTKIQEELISVMREEGLKSWKTEKANFARSTRYSVAIDPIYKKSLENRMKEGEEIENYKLNKTEFISIRVSK